jgi:hypothetical protein
MKKVITTLFVFVFISVAYAQICKVTYFAREGEKFWLIVDGEKKNEEPMAKVSFTLIGIGGMTKKTHHVKIIFEDEKAGSIDTSFKTNYLKSLTFMIYRQGAAFRVKKTKSSMSMGFM